MDKLPFFQVTLPLMVTFIATVWAASWSQNKRLDEMERFDGRLEEMSRGVSTTSWPVLAGIPNVLMDHDRRITMLE